MAATRGRLLALVEKKEEDDAEAVRHLLMDMPFLGMAELVRADLAATEWAARLDQIEN